MTGLDITKPMQNFNKKFLGMKSYLLIILMWLSLSVGAVDVAEYLNEISVTIRSNSGSGSGVLVTRGDISYCLTAAHVVSENRSVRKIIDFEGNVKHVINYSKVKVVKTISQDGRDVGKIELEAEIVRFSDPEHGDDIALLKILKREFVSTNITARFYSKDDLIRLSEPVLNCGSSGGEALVNSVTSGIYSQRGRVIDDKVYDQISSQSLPGASGSGIFLLNGEYIGMLTRGLRGSESFNFIVPIRRIKEWAKRTKTEFLFNESLEFDKNVPIEDPAGKVSLQ